MEFSADLFDGVLNRRAFDVGREEDPKIRSFNMVQLGKALTDPALDSAAARAGRLQQQPGHDRPEPEPRAPGPAPRGPADGRGGAADHRHRPPRRLRLPGHHRARAPGPVHVVGPGVPRRSTSPRWRRGARRGTNTDFFRGLARRMGYTEPWLYESDEQMVKGLLDSRHPYLAGTTYEQLRERGWLRLALPEPWLPFAERAASRRRPGKCELYSKALAGAGARPAAALRAAGRRRRRRRAAAAIRWPCSRRSRPATSTTRATRARRASARPRASRGCRCTRRTRRVAADPGRRHACGSSTTAAR